MWKLKVKNTIYIQTVLPHNGQTSGARSTGNLGKVVGVPNLRISSAIASLLLYIFMAGMGQFYLPLPFV
jgi:hypothetical protein